MSSRLFHLVFPSVAALALTAWAEPARSAAPPLSPAGLELIAAGVALYPDPVLEQLLAAAQHPLAVQRAARPSPGGPGPRRPQFGPPLPDAVAKLKDSQPELMKLLADQPGLTTQLGFAARRQPVELRAAIAKVRGAVETQWTLISADGDAELAAAADQVTATYLKNEALVAELSQQAAALESGLASGGGQLPELGTTTGAGKSIDETVTGPRGGTATAQGSGQGSVTTLPNKTTYQASGGGAVAATSPAGKSASATGEGQVKVTQKNDGTTDVSASGGGSATGPDGQTKTGSASMSGTVTTIPDGTKSYQGSGTATTDKGTVSTSTAAGAGQASTTVTTGQGTKTYTAGDGEITNQPQPTGAAKQPSSSGSSTNSTTNSTATKQKPQSQKPSGAPAKSGGAQKPAHPTQGGAKNSKPPVNYSQMNQKQMQQANKAHQQSWNATNQQMKKPQGKPQPKPGGKGKGRG